MFIVLSYGKITLFLGLLLKSYIPISLILRKIAMTSFCDENKKKGVPKKVGPETLRFERNRV